MRTSTDRLRLPSQVPRTANAKYCESDKLTRTPLLCTLHLCCDVSVAGIRTQVPTATSECPVHAYVSFVCAKTKRTVQFVWRIRRLAHLRSTHPTGTHTTRPSRRSSKTILKEGESCLRCTSQGYVQMHKCSNVQMHKRCTNAQILKCANAQMHKCSNANAQMLKCSNAQMHKCANAQMRQYYANAQVY